MFKRFKHKSILAIFLSDDPPECPDDWLYFPSIGCYGLFEESVDYSTAAQRCKEKNKHGQLAMPKTEEQTKMILQSR